MVGSLNTEKSQTRHYQDPVLRISLIQKAEGEAQPEVVIHTPSPVHQPSDGDGDSPQRSTANTDIPGRSPHGTTLHRQAIVILLLGPSGSGKSSFVKALAKENVGTSYNKRK